MKRIGFKKLFSVVLASCLLLSFGGCGNKAVIESMQDEIDELEDENKDLKKANESLQDEIDELKSQIIVETDPTATPTDTPDGKSEGGQKVGISLPTKDLQRWNQDGDLLKKGLEENGYEVDLQYAGNAVDVQLAQIETMVNSGCDVLIVACIDATCLGTALEEAKDAGITVIAYDRLIMDTDAVDYYVTFDNYMVGVIQAEYVVEALDLDSTKGPYYVEFTAGDPSNFSAVLFFNGAMDVLKPYIDSGKVVVASGQVDFDAVATEVWSTDNAQARAENIAAAFYSDGTDIDAWICSNDSTALGVTNGLENYYSGSWPIITGQDCDLANVKNIINGKQAMSVFKDTRTLVSQTVKMVDQIFNGSDVDVNDNSTYNNGSKIVPAYLCEPVFADINNYKEILIDSGYYTEADLG